MLHIIMVGAIATAIIFISVIAYTLILQKRANTCKIAQSKSWNQLNKNSKQKDDLSITINE